MSCQHICLVCMRANAWVNACSSIASDSPKQHTSAFANWQAGKAEEVVTECAVTGGGVQWKCKSNTFTQETGICSS